MEEIPTPSLLKKGRLNFDSRIDINYQVNWNTAAYL